MMKVSVVGCGNISKTHLPILQSLPGVEISSVVDIKPERADLAAEKYGCRVFYDFDAMLAADRPDSIHICTPHYLHTEMAVKALENSINVLCEKPCAITKGEISALKEAASKSSALFGVCFQNRYNACVKKAKEIIESKKFGALVAQSGRVSWFRDKAYYSDDWHGKRATEGGGVLVNQAIHTADLLRYLSGSEVKSVCGHVFNDSLEGVIEVEDTASVRYEFENGVIAVLNATNAFAFNADVSIELYFESGDKLYIEGAQLYHFEKDGTVTRLTDRQSAASGGKSYWGNGHAALIEDFYRCIREKSHFPIDAFEGTKASEEFLAVYDSAKSGKSVRLTVFGNGNKVDFN